jgi:hypothetical protein
LKKNGFDTKLPDSDLTNYKIPTRQLKRMEGMKKTQQNTNNNGKFSSLKLKKSLKAQSEPVIRKKDRQYNGCFMKLLSVCRNR